jgi:hypothetical protein
VSYDRRCYDLAYSFLLLKDNIPQGEFDHECKVLAQLIQDVIRSHLKRIDERDQS